MAALEDAPQPSEPEKPLIGRSMLDRMLDAMEAGEKLYLVIYTPRENAQHNNSEDNGQ